MNIREIKNVCDFLDIEYSDDRVEGTVNCIDVILNDGYGDARFTTVYFNSTGTVLSNYQEIINIKAEIERLTEKLKYLEKNA